MRGGRFFRVEPAAATFSPGRVAATLTRVTDVESQLQQRLLKAHRGALGITLLAERFDEAAFETFAAVRDRLGQALNRAKRRPFARVPANVLAEQLGQPLDNGGEDNFCRVTGEEVPAGTTAAHAGEHHG